MYVKRKQIRHTRILDIRSKISKGWSMTDLLNFCKMNLGVSKVTAISYIDEAAAPFRKKFEKEENNVTT